jgi:hypothetical protein
MFFVVSEKFEISSSDNNDGEDDDDREDDKNDPFYYINHSVSRSNDPHDPNAADPHAMSVSPFALDDAIIEAGRKLILGKKYQPPIQQTTTAAIPDSMVESEIKKPDSSIIVPVEHPRTAPVLPFPPAQAKNESGKIDLSKYKKMKKMIPEGAVRQKMAIDGISAEIMNRFFRGELDEVDEEPTKVVAMEDIVEDEHNEEKTEGTTKDDPRFEPFIKMRKILPSEALKQRMRKDNIFTEEEIDKFAETGEIPKIVTAPPSDAKDDDRFEPFVKMRKILPAEALKQRMQKENIFSQQEIDKFVETGEVPKILVASPFETKDDDRFEPFVKMRKILPGEALKQRMRKENIFSEEEIDKFVETGEIPKIAVVPSSAAKEDDRFEPFVKMRKLLQPPQVKQKMRDASIFTEEEIEKFVETGEIPKIKDALSAAPSENVSRLAMFQAISKKVAIVQKVTAPPSGPVYRKLFWKDHLISDEKQLKNTICGEIDPSSLPSLNKNEQRTLAFWFENVPRKKKDETNNNNNDGEGKENTSEPSEGKQNDLDNYNSNNNANNNSNNANNNGKKGDKKAAKVSLIDSKLEFNLEIVLKDAKKDLKAYIFQYYQCSTSLTKEHLETIKSSLPEESVINNLLQYPSYKDLTPINQILYSCFYEIPFFSKRITTMLSFYEFHETINGLKELITMYHGVYLEVDRLIPSLKEIFSIILMIGNYINTQTPVISSASNYQILPAAQGEEPAAEEEDSKKEDNEESQVTTATPSIGLTFSAIEKTYLFKANQDSSVTLFHFILLYIQNHCSPALLTIFENKLMIPATKEDPFDKVADYMKTLKSIHEDIHKDKQFLEQKLIHVRQEREETNLKLTALLETLEKQQIQQEEEQGQLSTSTPSPAQLKILDEVGKLKKSIEKATNYESFYVSLLEKIDQFDKDNSSFYQNIGNEYEKLYSHLVILLEKFGEIPVGQSKEKPSADGMPLEKKVSAFFFKFLKFIEEYENAKKFNRQHCKKFHSQLTRFTSEKKIETSAAAAPASAPTPVVPQAELHREDSTGTKNSSKGGGKKRSHHHHRHHHENQHHHHHHSKTGHHEHTGSHEHSKASSRDISPIPTLQSQHSQRSLLSTEGRDRHLSSPPPIGHLSRSSSQRRLEKDSAFPPAPSVHSRGNSPAVKEGRKKNNAFPPPAPLLRGDSRRSNPLSERSSPPLTSIVEHQLRGHGNEDTKGNEEEGAVHTLYQQRPQFSMQSLRQFR